MRLDDLSAFDSLIHRWEPRTKLIGLIIFIFTIAFLSELRLLIIALIIAELLFIASRIPISFLLKSIRIPMFFIAIIGISLIFFSSGAALFSIGPLSIKKEGLEAAAIIGIRFFSIITVVIVLFGTTQFVSIMKVLRSFGLSNILIDMAMFTYRYLFELLEQLEQMQLSMKLRGFNKNRFKNITIIASLMGTLLIRSYEKSERVYNAMVMRGYGQNASYINVFETKRYDLLFLIAIILISCFLIIAQLKMS